MFNAIRNSGDGLGEQFLTNSSNLFATCIGKIDVNFTEEANREIMCITADHVCRMYKTFLEQRNGIGKLCSIGITGRFSPLTSRITPYLLIPITRFIKEFVQVILQWINFNFCKP